MKILQLAQFYDPVIGGEERHVRTLGQCLAQRGHSITLITFATAANEGETSDGDVRIIRVRPSASRLPFVYSDRSWPHAMPIPDPAITHAITTEVAKNRPNIAHAHNWVVNSALRPLRRAGVPLVMTLHDYSQVCPTKRLMEMRRRDCTGPALAKCLACSAEKFGRLSGTATLLGNASLSRRRRDSVDQFISVSEAVASRVASRPKQTIVAAGVDSIVIPNFIPDSQVVEGVSRVASDAPIAFVGDLSKDKGITVLLQAYRRLRHAPSLILVGRRMPDTPEDLPRGAYETGPLPHSAAMDLVRDAQVLVVPSTWQDPCPTVVLEGMAAARPVVASAVGGITDMVADGETGLLVPPGDADALAVALSAILSDRERATSMGQAGRDRSRSFTVSAVVDRLERVYSKHAPSNTHQPK
jgi:glycosyltransferase involved in cell wall biosynthesis